MAEVIVSRLARNDLVHIHDYIRDELSNPDAALRIMVQLKQAMESLQSMPERGKPWTPYWPSIRNTAFWSAATTASSTCTTASRSRLCGCCTPSRITCGRCFCHKKPSLMGRLCYLLPERV